MRVGCTVDYIHAPRVSAVFAGLSAVSMGADTKANTWGGGALQVCDVRFAEDGGECGGALVSDTVAEEPANKGENGS
eukprot:scaffold22030_cov66-Phaeocystis_antarctica.AAC.3